MARFPRRETKSSRLRARLDHPVIDADGHVIEAPFLVPEYLKEIGGPSLVATFEKALREVRQPGQPKALFWGAHSGALSIDRVTTMLPRLYRERLDEAGLDFATMYSTLGLVYQIMPHDEVRWAACRALNMMNSEMFKEVGDRMTPAALIPMHTPHEAIQELEFAVKELGMRAAMIANEVRRPNFTPLALDAPYDYDPFWAKCVELKVAPAGHSANYGGTHGSPTNYVYNRLGLFATGGFAAARALFLAGVTQRFPTLNIGFLEGGVWWGAALYNDLFEFWEKRNVAALLERHDPAKIDIPLMAEMIRRYGGDGPLTAEKFLAAKDSLYRDGRTRPDEVPDFVDDWKHVSIRSPEDIRDAFVDSFYFGCEADDALNYTAFNARANKFGVKLKAMFSSDLGHWDVVDFGDPLEEAYEAVEHGLMSEDDFRAFTFVNPARFAARANPDYFKGTAVEGAVGLLMGGTPHAT